MESKFFGSIYHSDALRELANICISHQEYAGALLFLDRLTRVAPPNVETRLAKADVLRLMGFREDALRELDKSVQIDPTSPNLNGAILRWGREDDRRGAAFRILASDRSTWTLYEAAARELLAGGDWLVRRIQFVEGIGIVGWAVWSNDGPLRIEVRTGSGSSLAFLEASRGHPLSHLGSAADVILACEGTYIDLILSSEGQQPIEQMVRGLAGLISGTQLNPAAVLPEEQASHVDVIVPVYDDFDATRDCLETLLKQKASVEIRVTVVDDASPAREIQNYLDGLAAAGAINLIRNSQNLGYVGAVNAAFQSLGGGDVLLLNADAYLPPGAIERLRQAVYADPRIGSAAPFSNNSELTSFPVPFVENEMPTKADILRLDRAFERANCGRRIVIPVGTGFCLYIKAACRVVTGELSPLYGPGYGEDIEWALAARAQGYLHVCAADVYVGHAGARSFRATKRATVMRNLRVIAERYPDHERETLAFMNADPLAKARGAAEMLCPPSEVRRLLVDAVRRDGPALGARARQLQTEGEASRILVLRRGISARTWELRGLDAEGPKCLDFSFEEDFEAIRDYVGSLALDRIEVVDIHGIDDELLALLTSTNVPLDVVCSDAWPLRPRPLAASTSCSAHSGQGPCRDCAARSRVDPSVEKTFLDHRRRLSGILTIDSRIIAIDNLSASFASHAWSLWPLDARVETASSKRSAIQGALGIFVPTPAPEVDRFVKTLGRTIAVRGADIQVIVFGSCIDDLAAMASGTVFVTGPIKTNEYRELLSFHNIGALISPYRASHGWVLEEATLGDNTSPRAFFDWSFGAISMAVGDLALDPRVCDFQAAQSIVSWIEAGQGRDVALEGGG